MRVAQAVVVGGLWAAGRERLKRAQAARALAEAQLADTAAGANRLQQQLKRRDAELVHRRELIERLQRGRRAERDWNRELRDQLQREHASHGPLLGGDDPRELILRATIELLHADKGLLLSRSD